MKCYICQEEIETPEEFTLMEDLPVHRDCLDKFKDNARHEVTPENQND